MTRRLESNNNEGQRYVTRHVLLKGMVFDRTEGKVVW